MDAEDESTSYLTLFNEGSHNYLLHSGEDGLNDAFPVEPIFTEIASDWPPEGFPILLSGSLVTDETQDSESANTNGELLNEDSQHAHDLLEDNMVTLFLNGGKNGLIDANDPLMNVEEADDGESREKTVTHVINGDTYSITYTQGAQEEVAESDENVETIHLLNIDGTVTTLNKNLLDKADNNDRANFDNFYTQIQANKCKLCSFLCENVPDMVAHIKLNHEKELHHNGEIGNGEVVATKMTSILNMNQDKKYTLYLCSDCGSGYSEQADLKQHMIAQHKMIKTSAPAPAEGSLETTKPPETGLRRLARVAHAALLKEQKALRKVKCSIKGCLLRFVSETEREKHEDCHVGQNKRQFMCPTCKKMFSMWRVCSMHMWKYHSIDLGLLTCPMCSKFKSYSSVRVINHMAIHKEEKPFVCTSCGKGYKQLTQLRNHGVSHRAPHEVPSSSSQNQCESCDRYFANAKSLKKHIKFVHEKFKPFICNICGHQTSRKEMLQVHHRQHTGDKPYQCLYCEYKTGDRNCLRKHTMRHFGAVKYSCPHCAYQSIQTSAYKVHLAKKHPGKEGTYACALCRYTTINNRCYLSHVKIHELEKKKRANGKTDKGVSLEDSESKSSDETHPFLNNEHSEEAVDTGGITIPAGFDLQLPNGQTKLI